MDLRSILKYFEFTGIEEHEYAIGAVEQGRMCLLQNPDGRWEVFDAQHGEKRGLQVFDTDELACHHLYGVLAERHVDNGTLVPRDTLNR